MESLRLVFLVYLQKNSIIMNKKLQLGLFLVFASYSLLLAQKETTYQLNSGIVTDSASTIFFPVGSIDKGFGKMMYSEGYSNILVYNFNTEESRKLFPNDSLEIRFYKESYRSENRLISNNLYLFKTAVRAKNSFSSDCNPTVIYVCDKQGNQFKRVTPENENCVSIEFFEKQGFILLKMQKDINKDACFSNKDDYFYFKRLNIKDLSLGKDIELKK